MSKASILAVSLALLGASAPAWADVPPPDPSCAGKKEGASCEADGKTGSCVPGDFEGELRCDPSVPPAAEEEGCSVRAAGRDRTSGLVAAVLVAASLAALRGRRPRR